ncbi:MAG TPA: cytochrome c oxidase assembly protein [Gemmatimonadota bacterium]|nr:cytochrome c oxidase assembly protein [Gemmatimonadota bacterium]
MQWWCSVRAVAWDWTWRPFLGVWVLLALLVAGYVRLRRCHGVGTRGHTAAFAAAALAFWLGLDWPLGALAGYLASVHMLQFMLISLVAPPLLLYSIPPGAWARLAASGPPAWLRFVTHPLIALVLFNLIVFLTHWPTLVDALMVSQPGSFLINASWIAAGLVFWWPLVAPAPARPGFGPGLKMAYLFAATVTTSAPFLYLVFSALPMYSAYELAPPIEGITKREDQQVAGLLMKLGGAVVFWTGIAVVFWRWHRAEEA